MTEEQAKQMLDLLTDILDELNRQGGVYREICGNFVILTKEDN